MSAIASYILWSVLKLFDWLTTVLKRQGSLKFAIMKNGALSVTITGPMMMLMLPANNLATWIMVSRKQEECGSTTQPFPLGLSLPFMTNIHNLMVPDVCV